MRDKKIYILTGPIQSGKTTKLMEWSAGRKGVFGILTPVLNDKRVFMDVFTKEQFQMEAEPNEENTLQVGRFVFSKKAFKKANSILENAMKEKEGWLIIDEIGPLELRGEGFHETIKKILNLNSGVTILFVIRHKILDEVMQYYAMSSAEAIIGDINADFF